MLLCTLCVLAPVLAHGDAAAEAPLVHADRYEQRPRWEAGVAAVGFTVPDYPAADEYRSLALPLPYFVYRGRVLRADEESSRLRRRLAPNVELDISARGALSTDSEGSDAREGMPDLGYLLELGPNLRLSYPGAAPRSHWIVNLPVRGVISIGDPDVHWRGVVFAPELAYRRAGFMDGRLALRGSLRPTFAGTRLQRYFYEVAPQFATPQRPAYEASAGYLGVSLGAQVSWAFTPRLRGFLDLRHYNHAGAANDDSPLFRSENNLTAAAGFSWSFWQSRHGAED